MLTWLAAACAPATALPPILIPAATITPATAPTFRPAVTLAPTATVPGTRPATPTVRLVSVDYKVDGIISIEDLNTLLLEIRTLPGVADVQGGVGLVQVTFDPLQLSRQKIGDLITGRGYTVKE